MFRSSAFGPATHVKSAEEDHDSQIYKEIGMKKKKIQLDLRPLAQNITPNLPVL